MSKQTETLLTTEKYANVLKSGRNSSTNVKNKLKFCEIKVSRSEKILYWIEQLPALAAKGPNFTPNSKKILPKNELKLFSVTKQSFEAY